MAVGRGGMQALDTTTQVETPEHIHFDYALAGPARRAAAYFIDWVVRAAIVVALAIAGLSFAITFDGAGIGFILLALFVLEWGYYLVCELAMSGQSIGKRALRLRVVSGDGRPLSASQSFLRNLLRAADSLAVVSLGSIPVATYALGVTVVAFDRRFRRLGDMVSGTVVIVDDGSRLEKPILVTPPPSSVELASVPARLSFSPTEVEAIELFLRRSSQLPKERATQLAEFLAPRLAARFGCRYHDAARFMGVLYYVFTRQGGNVGRA